MSLISNISNNFKNTSNTLDGFLAVCRMIKIEHSVFALPFALSGAFLAANTLPSLYQLFFLIIAMVAIRSFAMAFNRVVDLKYDALNVRTQKRQLVTKEISVQQTYFFCIVMAIIFVIACASLNKVCFFLSIPALIFSAIYSYTKRFTWLCHFWLGITLGLAPLAGWLSINQGLTITPVLLFFAVIFWVAAFDILYSFQDVDFDKKIGLYSIPVHFGIKISLIIAGLCYIMASIFLLLMGWNANLSFYWYIIWLIINGILYYGFNLIKEDDFSKINMVFFNFNAIISILVFLGVLLGIFL